MYHTTVDVFQLVVKPWKKRSVDCMKLENREAPSTSREVPTFALAFVFAFETTALTPSKGFSHRIASTVLVSTGWPSLSVT